MDGAVLALASMDAARALADLTEISSQIQAAVLLGASGSVLASTLADDERTKRMAEGARALLAAAESASEGGTLVQLEAATPDGSVFVLRQGELLVAAVTTPEPTVGLVFYDLKSCLRAAAAEEGDGKPRPRAKRTAARVEPTDGAA
jgi:predicted regulator of Ras-like GTPase activity (Roadblock/LC7/MglB family)